MSLTLKNKFHNLICYLTYNYYIRAMIYQLPNGKIIYISIEVYLSMSDDDLKYINETNIGSSYSGNPFKISEESLEGVDYLPDDETLPPPNNNDEDESIDFTFIEE